MDNGRCDTLFIQTIRWEGALPAYLPASTPREEIRTAVEGREGAWVGDSSWCRALLHIGLGDEVDKKALLKTGQGLAAILSPSPRPGHQHVGHELRY